MPIPNATFIANPAADRLDILGSQILRILTGGDPTADSQWGKRECMLALEEVRAKLQADRDRMNADLKRRGFIENTELYRKQYFEDLDALYKYGGTADAWIRTFTLPVLFNKATGLSYFELPPVFLALDRYQVLPGEDSIRAVRRTLWHSNSIAPRYVCVSNGQASLLQNLYGGGMQGNIMVMRQDTNGVFVPDNALIEITDKFVDADLVIRPKRDTVPDYGFFGAVDDAEMVQGATNLLLKRGIQDQVSDNVPSPQIA